MYKFQVTLVGNAVLITTYTNTNKTTQEVIPLRWWQRRQADIIVERFYLENKYSINKKGITFEVIKKYKLKYHFLTGLLYHRGSKINQ